MVHSVQRSEWNRRTVSASRFVTVVSLVTATTQPLTATICITPRAVRFKSKDAILSTDMTDRRDGPERRRNTFSSLWVGAIKRRRRNPRRPEDVTITSVDWHHPQWLAVGLLILLLSCFDAFLTLNLMDHGADEANPFMVPLVAGAGRSFALWKVGLTALGVSVLILLADRKSVV